MGGTRSPRQVSTITPEQKQLLNQILSGAGEAFPQGLEALLGQLDPETAQQNFQKSVADPAIRQFQGSVIPSILQSSANLGAKGGSSIDRQLARAGSQLELGLSEQFAGMQAGQQQAGLQNLLQLLFPGIQQQTFALQDRGPSFGQSLGAGLLGGLGAAGQSYFGGR